MIFVPATPRSQLKQRYVIETKETGFEIKVIELSGATITGMLQREKMLKNRPVGLPK